MTTSPTTRLLPNRLLESLDADFRRMLDLADGDLTATVPTCPEWTLGDLVEHVAMVYLHKVETMRQGAFPKDWPPNRPPEAPAAFLRRAYAALAEEFAARERVTRRPPGSVPTRRSASGSGVWPTNR